MNRSNVSRLLSITLAAGALIHRQSARADVITATWNNNASFAYEITHMPDLDQIRGAGPGVIGLAADGGMFCVPTSALNMVMYAANHGFPNLLPGPADWQSQANYNAATLNLAVMGSLMNTDPLMGTGGTSYDGMRAWLDQNAEGAKFTVEMKYPTGTMGPNLNSLTQAAINGSLVAFGYGRYEKIGIHNDLPLYKRGGGHAVTMARAERDGTVQQLWSRDPADDGELTTQSAFANRRYDVEGKAVYVEVNGTPELRFFSALNYNDKADVHGFIDGAMLLRPKTGYAFTSTEAPTLFMDAPTVFEGSLAPAGEIALGTGILLDGQLAGDLTGVFTLNELPGIGTTVFHVDLLEGVSTPLGSLSGGKQIVVTPNGRVYVLSAEQLQCIDVTSVPPAIESVGLPFTGTALAYDSFRKEIVVLCAPSNRLLRFTDLAHASVQMFLPTPISVNADTKVQINPRDGMYWFGSPNSNILRGWNPSGPVALYDQITLPAVQVPISIDFDDAGAIYVCTGDDVVAMSKASQGAWEIMQDFHFNLPQGAKLFKITKSETNFDPEIHNGPGYVNLAPELLSFGELEIDCYADLNRDRTVDVDDLLMLINGWGPCPIGPCVSDVNGNRATNVDDLIQLINAWGACS